MRWRGISIGTLLCLSFLMAGSAYGSDTGQVKLAQREVECLALNDYHEARGEPTVGRIAVAFVVLNRVHTQGFPKTICGVVNEIREGRCQFSWFCGSHLVLDPVAWKSSLRLAKLLLDPETMIVDPTHGALHYHEASLNPVWTRSYKFGIKIGSHLFYPKGSEE